MWTRHYQHVWLERSQDHSFTLWFRVACLALGTHRANGHAEFAAGEIADRIEVVNRSTGELRSPKRQEIQRVILEAVAHKFLSESSGSLCLVVPPHAVGGGLGSEHAVCPTHKLKAARAVPAQRTPSGGRGNSFMVSSPAETR